MKKHVKRKRFSGPTQFEPDMAGLINKMQEHLVSLEMKIDILISKSLPRPAEAKPFPKPFQQSGQAHSHGDGRQNNNYRERVLHKAICADCKKECEVPFKPSGERPVYCKECFSKRKAGSPEGRPAASYRGEGSPEGRPAASYRGEGNPPGGRSDNRPREAGHPQIAHIEKPRGGEKKRHVEKKKLAGKRRKGRA